MFRDGGVSIIESCHEPGSGAAHAGGSQCKRAARREAGAVPGIRRALSSDAARKAPAGGRCVHEIKLDGYRTQAHLHNGRPAIYTARLLRSWEKTSDHAPAWIELEDIAPIRFRKKARG